MVSSLNSAALPPLDPGFQPAARWNRHYRARVARDRAAREIAIALVRDDASVSVHHDRVLSAGHEHHADSLRYVERLVKFLLWQKGGYRVLIAGAPEIAAELVRSYQSGGDRAFDAELMGGKIYRRPFAVEPSAFSTLPVARENDPPLGGSLDGCRIGFDLGGSDRKAAALIDGTVVYSEEISWNPYFQSDPAYHLAGIEDTLARAAAHLPRVDAIGGSAAGTYVRNEVRAGSLFRGVPVALFEEKVRRMFIDLQRKWGGVPFEVVNDGEVTALAGAQWLRANSVLGISMGTSQAAGYVTPAGTLTPWLNELAFAPVDYRPDAPADEWSGDRGCGVQYFSQQAVARLAERAGFSFEREIGLPERLKLVQEAMERHDPRAAEIYETVGVYLGHALAHCADFYAIDHALLLGRVTTGEGGARLVARAQQVLQKEYPEIAERIRFHLPPEKERRHGQAMAAASLPRLRSCA